MSGTKYPISDYIGTSGLSPSYAHFCSLITAISEPKSYFEAVKDPKWQNAMADEIAALESNQTCLLLLYLLTKRPLGANGYIESSIRLMEQ